MARIFTDCEDELGVKFNINKNYAEKYDNWRRKEELQKFKDRYGKDALERSEEDSSSSSSDDGDALDMPGEFDKEFYRTLSSLKSKDPKIYDKRIKFFENIDPLIKGTESKLETKTKPMFLRDYERKVIQQGGKLFDEDEETEDNEREKAHSPSYFEEQEAIKESFKGVFHTAEVDDCKDGQGIGGLFSKKIKSRQELEKEEDEYAAWLLGNKGELNDAEEENKLSHLRSYWTDPALDSEEVFLRDYILQKKFKAGVNKDKKGVSKVLEDEESYSDGEPPNRDLEEQEEKEIEAMEEFEHKFNFRFEEPDQEFIKRYPRTLDHSLRKKDDKRKQKRDELRTRKETEKQKLKEQLGKAKELKQKEIEERLKQLCNITGNADIGFKGNDLDEDFDPAEHDRRMKEIFSEDTFYAADDNEKPVFPLIDEELDIEEWDTWGMDEAQKDGTVNQKYPHSSGAVNDGFHSEDPNFNMDCDYDPKKNFQQEMVAACQKKSKCERGKGRRWRARQSRLAMGLMKEKPQFDPVAILSKAKLCKGDSATAFEKYVDEYYGLEYEDVIGGDLPCRFKYRKVIPNDFGLSVEEILNADDKELNRWCSLKKAVQIRPEKNEKYDLQAYVKKGSNLNLKRKVFRSLYTSSEEPHLTEDLAKEKSKKIKRKHESSEDNSVSQSDGLGRLEKVVGDDTLAAGEAGAEGEACSSEGTPKKKKKRKRCKSGKVMSIPLEEPIISKKKSAENVVVGEEIRNGECEEERRVNVKRMVVNEGSGKGKNRKTKDEKSHKRKRKGAGVKYGKIKKQQDPVNYLSDLTKSRLKAYGMNPKRFGNKLKYKQST